MADDFFEDKQEEAKVDAPEKIKVGEKEYSQEDLNRIVELGEIANEVETKQNTKIGKLYPAFTQATQKLSELEKKLADSEAAKVEKKVETGEQLSPEELKAQALKQAKELGLVTADDFNQYYLQRRDAERLIEDTESIISGAKEDGKPETTTDELLKYMQESGIKNPEKAYKLMFENELDEWKSKQTDKLKRPGLVTEGSSAAGGKEPAPIKVTKDNIAQLLQQALEE